MIVGGSRFVREAAEGNLFALREHIPEGSAVAAVGIDDRPAGILVLLDQIRL